MTVEACSLMVCYCFSCGGTAAAVCKRCRWRSAESNNSNNNRNNSKHADPTSDSIVADAAGSDVTS